MAGNQSSAQVGTLCNRCVFRGDGRGAKTQAVVTRNAVTMPESRYLVTSLVVGYVLGLPLGILASLALFGDMKLGIVLGPLVGLLVGLVYSLASGKRRSPPNS